VEKIIKMIESCRLGVHDISRTELDRENQLPRFNMPFELGLFAGAARFGTKAQTNKISLILDRERYRFQKFISDIAGQDIAAHKGEPQNAIKALRTGWPPFRLLNRCPAAHRSPNDIRHSGAIAGHSAVAGIGAR